MGHLEAAEDQPYHGNKASPHHTATGGRRRSWCSAACSAVVENEGCFPLVLTAVTVTVMLLAVFALTAIYSLTYHAPCFSVHLTGYGGLDPGRAARLVSPSFDVTLRVNNTCIDSADVAVMYSGVALGWARVEPRDCAEGRWARDVEVVARGRGVGLSQRLRDRMASDWRLGALELDVDVKMYREGYHTETPQNMIIVKVTILDEKNLFDM